MQIEHQRTVLACTIVCLLVFVVMLGGGLRPEKEAEAGLREPLPPQQGNGAGRAGQRSTGATSTNAASHAWKRTNKRLDSQLEQQQQQQQRQPRRRTGAARRHPQAEEAKYSSSKVTDEQRDIILQRINKVMRNPGELLRQATSRSHKLSTLVGSNSPLRVAKSSTRHWAKNFRSFISEYRINEAQLRPARQPTTTATTPSGP